MALEGNGNDHGDEDGSDGCDGGVTDNWLHAHFPVTPSLKTLRSR